METTGKDGDTVKLLRECDAGIKMGIESINEVLDKTKSEKLRGLLSDSRNQHEKLQSEVSEMLRQHGDEGKSPNPMVKGMGWIKTNAMLLAEPGDATVADLMTDGSNMGVKSLSRYINQYRSADDASRRIGERLVNIELQLTEDLRQFL